MTREKREAGVRVDLSASNGCVCCVGVHVDCQPAMAVYAACCVVCSELTRDSVANKPG